MKCNWLEVSPSLQKGVAVINQLEDIKFEPFLRRILAKIKLQGTEIFTECEREKLEKIFKINEKTLLLAIKTVVYLSKRLHKFIFMPADLKSDLNQIGICHEKAELFIKAWSSETRATLSELRSESIHNDSLNFSWKLNAELSSGCRKKCKVPKAYLSLTAENNIAVIEMTHPELYTVFLQFEAIQNELDSFM